MPLDTLGVVKEAYARWAQQDVDGVAALLHEDAEYTMHLSETLAPFAGSTRGREGIRAQLASILEHFEMLAHRPLPPITVDGEVARCQCEFLFRHRATGAELMSRLRHVWIVRDGLVVRFDEYFDRAKLEAFLALYVSGSQPGPPPPPEGDAAAHDRDAAPQDELAPKAEPGQ